METNSTTAIMEIEEGHRMSQNIGKKIKYFRTKAKMTQDELARGIISVSYLSKIESNNAYPSPEIMGLLCERLNVDPNKTDEDNTSALCVEWFKSILDPDINKATKLYEKIENTIEGIIDAGFIHLVEIHKLHFFILTDQKQLVESQLQYLNEGFSFQSNTEKYYYNKFLGNYYFYHMNYKKALTSFIEAEKLIDKNIYFFKSDQSDLYYLLSITASKLYHSHLALVYATKALEYYQSIFDLERSAKCHILLGISYFRTKEHDKAIASYELAGKIGKTMNNNELLSLSNQNLGRLYSITGNKEKAINYFLTSYEFKKESPKADKVITIISLLKEYYDLNDMESAKKWLHLGLSLSEELTPTDSYYIYEIEVYHHLIYGYGEDFENLLVDRILPFFEEKQLLNEKAMFESILADFYFHNRKYKSAALYYRSANKSLKEVYLD